MTWGKTDLREVLGASELVLGQVLASVTPFSWPGILQVRPQNLSVSKIKSVIDAQEPSQSPLDRHIKGTRTF